MRIPKSRRPNKTKVVQVELYNRHALMMSEYPDELDEFYSYRMPGYQFSPKYRMRLWDGYIHLMRCDRVPSGLFLATREQAEEKLHLRFLIEDLREPPMFRALPARLRKRVRDYQEAAVQAMIQHSGTGGLVLNATGTGKTFLAGVFLARLKSTACFVVDELTLLDQAREELQGVLKEPVGMVGAQKFETSRVTVATIQTLHKHRLKLEFRKWFRNLQVLIIDEVHLALNRRNLSIVDTVHPRAVYGLTATLEMQKKDIRTRATALTGPVIYTYALSQGVEDRVLVKGIVCRVVCSQDADAGMRDYQQAYRALIVNSGKRNGMVERLARAAIRAGHRVIVLVERLQHLRFLSRRLQDVNHEVIDGSRSRADRSDAKVSMEAGQLPLILANRVFAKGINIKACDVIIDATGSRSKNSAAQRYGRGTRTLEGKQGLLYFDIADTGEDNRFAACSRSRKRAFAALKVPVCKVAWKSSGQVLRHAERFLKSQLRVSV